MNWFLIALIATFLWAISNIVDEFIVKKYSIGKRGSGGLVLFTSFMGIFMAILIGIFTQGLLSIPFTDKVLLIITGGLTIGWIILYLYTLETEDVSSVVPWFLTIPIFGYILGFIFLGETFALKKIKVDFNVHDQNDLPINRKGAFWHNNRSIYLRKEIELYGRTIIGENVFAIPHFDEKLLQLEVVRVLSSLVYQTRKYIFNKSSDRENLIQILKWCIYAVQYSLAYKNIFPSSKLEAIKIFKTIFKTKTDPKKFLILKIGKDQISTNHIKKAYEFLCEIDLILLKDWKLKNYN